MPLSCRITKRHWSMLRSDRVSVRRAVWERMVARDLRHQRGIGKRAIGERAAQEPARLRARRQPHPQRQRPRQPAQRARQPGLEGARPALERLARQQPPAHGRARGSARPAPAPPRRPSRCRPQSQAPCAGRSSARPPGGSARRASYPAPVPAIARSRADRGRRRESARPDRGSSCAHSWWSKSAPCSSSSGAPWPSVA